MSGVDDEVAAARTGAGGLTIESIVAVDAPREFRVHPRDRVIAYTAESGGARQLFTLALRAGGSHADAGDRLGAAGQRPAVVARRTAAGLRPRRRDLGRRGRRRAARPGGRQARWRPGSALVAGWPPTRVSVASTWLGAGLGRRRPGAPARPAAARPAPARAPRRDRLRHRRRGLCLVAGRCPARDRCAAGARAPRHRADRRGGRGHWRRRDRRGRGQPRHGRHVAARRVAAVCLRCQRLVPGRPPDPGWPRPDRPDRRRARTRRSDPAASGMSRWPLPTAAASCTSRSTTA